jgi:hypothetical protein
MFNVTIMLVVAIAFSITMLGPWGFIKDAANVTESRQITSFLIYAASIWGLAPVSISDTGHLFRDGRRQF